MERNKFSIQESFVISAGAGSGKTYTLSRRYINAVLGFDFFTHNKNHKSFIEYKDSKKAEVSEIVTITYTEAAALEMKERIFSLMEKIIEFDTLSKKDSDFNSINCGMKKLNKTEKKYVINRLKNAIKNSNSAFISTIHSFCLEIISKHSDIAKLDSEIEIIQDDEKEKILDDVIFNTIQENEKLSIEIFKINNRFQINQLIQKYCTNANFRNNLDNFFQNPLNLETYKEIIKELDIDKDIEIDEEKEKKFTENLQKSYQFIQIIFNKYKTALKKENKMDFDSIIEITASIVDKIKNNYKYILVDEFQDTNFLQNKIISKIAKNKNLFLVGDSKQSIYAFQGAELEVFHNAIKEFEQEPMNINYRSDKKILEFVNNIFRSLFKIDSEKKLIDSNFKAKFNKEDELQPSSKSKKDGTVEFLISIEEGYNQIDNQMKNIAKFIKAIIDDKISGYEEVKQKIKNKEKAIGILFDSSTKMLDLKKELDKLGISAKISATENFYHTREINDIFLVLKSIEILKRKNQLNNKDKFYIAGALRSTIIRKNEEEIIKLLNNINSIKEIFSIYMNQNLTISKLIKFIVDESKMLDIFVYLGELHQRNANIEKLIHQAIEFEMHNSSDLYKYLDELQKNIYFKNVKEDEAFYKAENLESIEICTIHSTKGLAYPMVILAQSEKNLSSNASGDMGLSFNSFSIQGKQYTAVGFKIDEYEPLVYRTLKEISKEKHKAEKKRLLYVALTRAEHNLIISGSIYQKKDKTIGLSDDSYLQWIVTALDIEKEDLFFKTTNKINFINNKQIENIKGQALSPNHYEIVEYTEDKIEFSNKIKKTASNSKKIQNNLIKQARVGTIIHSILEKYWNKLEERDIIKNLSFKYALSDTEQEKIKNYIQNFINTPTYKKLKEGVKHFFELEVSDSNTNGIIDLLYFDNGWIIVDFKSNNTQNITNLEKFAKENKYDEQLKTYKQLCNSKGIDIKETKLLFLDNGVEVRI